MKLSLDYHGVIDKNPELFINLSLSFDEVHILTGHVNDENFRKELGKLFHIDPWWNFIYSLTDELEKEGHEVLAVNNAGRNCYEQSTWDKAKAIYCKKHKIDLHIDDNAIYGKYFTTPFMLYCHK